MTLGGSAAGAGEHQPKMSSLCTKQFLLVRIHGHLFVLRRDSEELQVDGTGPQRLSSSQVVLYDICNMYVP